MSVTLTDFKTPVAGDGGTLYRARACGRLREDGMWEGWIEFESQKDGSVLRSARETSQPNLTDLEYWATGLTPVYLEGTLKRTLEPPRQPKPRTFYQPAFDGPAPPRLPSPSIAAAGPVMDPFAVHQRRPELLAKELRALSRPHLLNIIRAYALANGRMVDLEALNEVQLAELIVQRVARSG